MHSVCFGPFPYVYDSFEIKISALQKYNKLEKIAVCDQQNMEKYMEWIKIDNNGIESWYLVLKLHYLDKRVYGDFQFKCEFKTGINTVCKFYFWLNASALLYNEELKKVTAIRDEHRRETGADIEFKKENENSKRYEDWKKDFEAPIHFEEFSCIDEDSLKQDTTSKKALDKQMELIMYPDEIA